jgi:hypothetical protein
MRENQSMVFKVKVVASLNLNFRVIQLGTLDHCDEWKKPTLVKGHSKFKVILSYGREIL